ncbi:ABC transporter substrate-binding protein [Brevibacterium album]|uniref:ABC transporter substrate-binding protein n=1 Tax=Brevibacterium album TaxID=417948 RepID=UPI000410EE2F|nr:ABC transporter substrate-binding protein [Brevibacterium album]
MHAQPSGPRTGSPRSGLRAHRLAPAVAGLAVAALGLTACTTGSAGAGGGEGGGTTDTLRSTLIADPSSFDPMTSSGVPGTTANGLLYTTLLAQDEGGAQAGELAAEWEVSPEQGTFTLREGASCADGTPITPTVVKDSLDAFAEVSSNKDLVFGPSTPAITADDDAGTVTIELETPWADMAQGLTMPETGIVCPAGLEDPEGTAKGTVEAAFSGAYTLGEFTPGASVSFELREEGYTFPEYATPLEGEPAAHIRYTISADYNSIANSMIAGDLDLATITGEPMTRFDDQEGFAAERFSTGNLFLLFNEREGRPFADAEARRGVAQALDRQAFVQAATSGLGTPANSIVGDTVPCVNESPDALIAPDPKAAATALEGVSAVQLGTQAVGRGAGNTYINQVLGEAGADVELRTVDNAGLATELATKPESWDMAVINLINLSGTVYGGLSRVVGPTTEEGGRNSTGNPHPELLSQLGAAMAEEDETARCAIYAELQEQAFQDAVVVPLSDLPAQVTAAEGFTQRVVNGLPVAKTMRITG